MPLSPDHRWSLICRNIQPHTINATIILGLILGMVIVVLIATPQDARGEWDTFHGDPSRSGSTTCEYISGDILWEVDLGNGYVDTSPVISDGKVIVISAGDAGADSTVHCLEASTGDSIWDTTIPGKTYQLSTPVIGKGRVFFGSSSGVFYCLMLDTGQIFWQRALDTSAMGITSSPLFDEPSGNLYVGSGDGNLHNLDIGSGNTIWSYDTGDGIYFSSPALNGEDIIIGNDGGDLVAVREGSEQWRFTTGDQIRSSAAIQEDGRIFFASRDGLLRSLSSNGTLPWEAQIGTSASTPALHDGMVVVGSESGLHGFLADGTPVFHLATGGPVDSSPAITDDQIMLTTNEENGEIIITDHTGVIQWSYGLDDHSLSSPGLTEATFIVASDDSRVWCFHSTEPSELSIRADAMEPQSEGEGILTFTGDCWYDTGRPASGNEVSISFAGRTISGTTASNGSYSLNVTAVLESGNHTATVRVSDGTLSNETTVDVVVEKEGSESQKKDEDSFLGGFNLLELIPGQIILFFILGTAGKSKRKRRSY